MQFVIKIIFFIIYWNHASTSNMSYGYSVPNPYSAHLLEKETPHLKDSSERAQETDSKGVPKMERICDVPFETGIYEPLYNSYQNLVLEVEFKKLTPVCHLTPLGYNNLMYAKSVAISTSEIPRDILNEAFYRIIETVNSTYPGYQGEEIINPVTCSYSGKRSVFQKSVVYAAYYTAHVAYWSKKGSMVTPLNSANCRVNVKIPICTPSPTKSYVWSPFTARNPDLRLKSYVQGGLQLAIDGTKKSLTSVKILNMVDEKGNIVLNLHLRVGDLEPIRALGDNELLFASKEGRIFSINMNSSMVPVLGDKRLNRIWSDNMFDIIKHANVKSTLK